MKNEFSNRYSQAAKKADAAWQAVNQGGLRGAVWYAQETAEGAWGWFRMLHTQEGCGDIKQVEKDRQITQVDENPYAVITYALICKCGAESNQTVIIRAEEN
jgi:hypothetical protein